jgi:hypothetical protein
MGVQLQDVANRYILRAAELILSRYKPVTLECAYLILLTLDAHYDLVFWNNRWTHIDILALDYQPDVDIRTIPVRFWGGPPSTAKYYDGTIWMFILDRVATEIVRTGYEATRAKLRIS